LVQTEEDDLPEKPSPTNEEGTLFLIVGNSGSGKDSLIKEVLSNWPENKRSLRVPQRYITRPPHETEPFISVTPVEFAELDSQGMFCLKWRSYDMDYGVPTEICEWLRAGDNVLVNVSRNIISEAREKFHNMKLIFVYVPLEVSEERLITRHRESEEDAVFQERLERARQLQEQPDADFIVDNSGPLEIGTEKLREYLLSFS
jgi:ribose 1,5-bisphosphokinase